MDLTFTVVSWILFATAAISGMIAIYSHLKGYSNHQIYFTLMMIMIAEWAIMSTLESAALEIPSKIFWSKLEYIGAMTSSVFFLRYATGVAEIRNKWFTRYYFVYWILPVLIIVLAATNELHNIIWQGFSWSPAGNNILIYHHGPGFLVAMGYSLVLVGIALFNIIKALPEMPYIFKRQAWSVIIASIFPVISAIIYVTGNSPVEGLNITILSFLLTGIVLLFGITRYKIFDIAPFARRRLTEILRDGILIIDPENKIIYHNPAASELLKIQSRYFYSDLGDIKWLYNECVEYLNETSTDKELIAQGPEDLWLNIQIIKITDDTKNYKGHLVVLRNVTIRKKLEIQTSGLNDVLFNSHKQLLELNAQKDKILSIIGHDLKTPFHQITSLSQILKEDINGLDKDTVIELIDDIIKASESGYGILEEILEWAKTQRDSTSLNPQRINILKLIEEIIDSLNITAANKRIEFIKVIPEDAIFFADKNMTTIVFRNLLSNAIKFSYPGGKIILSSTSESGKSTISIQDFGVGIPANELSLLLTNSFKTSRQGTWGEKGTGLGLLLSRELIYKNNGTIEVESEQEKGTTFKIILPVE